MERSCRYRLAFTLDQRSQVWLGCEPIHTTCLETQSTQARACVPTRYPVKCTSLKARIDGCWSRRPKQLRSRAARSEEHTSELQSLMRISYAVFCLTKKK